MTSKYKIWGGGSKNVVLLQCPNLGDPELKMNCFIHRVLYMTLIVTTNQKPIIDKMNKK